MNIFYLFFINNLRKILNGEQIDLPLGFKLDFSGNRKPKPDLHSIIKINGYVTLFNHEKFKQNEPNSNADRPGSEFDALRICKTFSMYNFNSPIVHRDLTYNQVFNEVEKLKTFNFSEYAYFITFISSHGGENDQIITYDNCAYNLEKDFINPIVTENKTLLGKPKIFVINACKGTRKFKFTSASNKTGDASNDIDIDECETDDDGPTLNNNTRPFDDTVIIFSTYKGYISQRYDTGGSFFIQAFCGLIENHGQWSPLDDIIKGVNIILTEKHCYKQVPIIKSKLVKPFYFGDKIINHLDRRRPYI